MCREEAVQISIASTDPATSPRQFHLLLSASDTTRDHDLMIRIDLSLNFARQERCSVWEAGPGASVHTWDFFFFLRRLEQHNVTQCKLICSLVGPLRPCQ